MAIKYVFRALLFIGITSEVVIFCEYIFGFSWPMVAPSFVFDIFCFDTLVCRNDCGMEKSSIVADCVN